MPRAGGRHPNRSRQEGLHGRHQSISHEAYFSWLPEPCCCHVPNLKIDEQGPEGCARHTLLPCRQRCAQLGGKNTACRHHEFTQPPACCRALREGAQCGREPWRVPQQGCRGFRSGTSGG